MYFWVCVIASCILNIFLLLFFFFTILSFTVCPCSKVSCLMCVSITWLQENSEVQNKNQKPPHSCSGARTRTHAAPPYCTAQGTPFTLCSATWLPCYHSSVTSTERAWLRPPRVLKVCHWVKVARAAGRRGVADKKKKKKKGHMGEPTIENIQFSWLTRSHTQQGRSSCDSDVRARLVLSSLWAAQFTVTSRTRIPMWASPTSQQNPQVLVSGVFVTASEVVTVEFSCWEILFPAFPRSEMPEDIGTAKPGKRTLNASI